jgi:hypothetical protein
MIRPAPFAAILGLALALPITATGGAAQAQVMPEPDAAEVARTPLRDLNIDPQEIPPVLLKAATAPYATQGLGRCNGLVREIAALDSVLGADYDIADESGGDRLSEGRIGQSLVGAIIPFRGILREVTGAASNERTLQAAYTAGMVRRAFLKGWGMGRGCAYPARPKMTVASRK